MQEFYCARCMKKIGEGMTFCPHCGYDQRTPQAENALKRFTVLHGRYLVGNMIGKGGFGLTYVGMDLTLEMKVAIKEYYPSGTASRLHSYSNNVRWDTSDADWNIEREKNISRFLKEARRMARLDDVPGVVRVRDTFRENETAYIVMDFVEGDTLKKWLLAHGPMSWDMCRELLMPIVDSLAVIHDSGFIHRDIAPDNIMVRPNATARLLDLGAAVDMSSNNGQASMVVVKNNFSAPEQYDQNAVLGSWTDVYSMSATMYYCLTGKLMPSAIDRMMHSQTIEFPPERNVPENVAKALLAGMEMEPEHRIHDMRELKSMLLGSAERSAGAADGSTATGVEQTESWSDRVRRWADIQKERDASAGASQSQSSGQPSWQLGPSSTGGNGMPESQTGEASESQAGGAQSTEGVGNGGGNADETMPWDQPGAGGAAENDTGETMPWNQPGYGGNSSKNSDNAAQTETADDAQAGIDTEEADDDKTMPWNPADGNRGTETKNDADSDEETGGTENTAGNESGFARKKKTSVIAAALVLAVIVLISFAGFFISRTDEKMQKSAETKTTTERVETTEAEITTENVETTSGKTKEKYTLMSDEIDVDSSDPVAVFGSEYTRDQIVAISFLDSLESEPKDSWDVSEKKDGTIKAWVEEDGDGYHLYVASEGEIYAPENSRYLFAKYENCITIGGMNLFDTSRVTDMRSMFSSCKNLTELDISGFDTSQVTNMSSMFYYCMNLTKLDVSGFDTSQVTGMSGMFRQCYNLTELDVSRFDTSQVTNMSGMFRECYNLTELDVSGFDTLQVTNMSYMFWSCSSLTELDVSGWDTPRVSYMSYMFGGCSSLTELDVSGLNTSWVTDMSCMFNGCKSLTELDVSGFDTSRVTDIIYMFSGCSALTELDVSSFDTSQVLKMGSMFEDCSGLTYLDVSGFDTSKVSSMTGMFAGCSGLTEIDVSGFDTHCVMYMGRMFYGCSSLTELDVSGFDTSQVTNMGYMFKLCESLTELDVSGFDTSQVTEMDSMFESCSSLISLTLWPDCSDSLREDLYEQTGSSALAG